jgi:hypothetical protein
MFSTLIKDGVFTNGVENKQFLPKKRGTNLETQLLKVSHMSNSKNSWLSDLHFETIVFEHVWPPL